MCDEGETLLQLFKSATCWRLWTIRIQSGVFWYKMADSDTVQCLLLYSTES